MIWTTSFETKNILFNKNCWKIGEMNATFWKNIYNKGKVSLDIFWNFTYFSSALDLKSLACKRDFPLSSKLQTSRSWPRLVWKVLIEFCKLRLNGKHKNNLSILHRLLNFDLLLTLQKIGKRCKTTILERPQTSLKTRQHP